MNLRSRAESKLAEWADQRELRRTVLHLALPIVGSDLLQRGVNVVDALLVGRLGAAELAAVGLSQLLLMFTMALVYGLGVGSTVMVAFHTGAADERRRISSVRTSLLIGVLATVALGGAGLLFSRGVATFMGASGRLLDLTLDYLHITWYLFGAYVFLHLASAVFQGIGDTRTPLWAMVGVNILHVLVAVPLVFGLAGLVRSFVKVDDDYSASYRPGWCAAATVLTAHEGKRHRETKVRFDAETRKAHYLERDLEKNAVVAENTIDIPACVHDVIGGLQRLREMLPAPGTVTELPVSDGKKAVMARVEAQGRERVSTPVGEFQSIRYEAFLMSGVLYRRKGRLFVWISEDERRLPVRIRVQLPFYIGTVTVQLEKVE